MDNSVYMGSLLLLPRFYYAHPFAFYTRCNLCEPIPATAVAAHISPDKSLILTQIGSEPHHGETITTDERQPLMGLDYRMCDIEGADEMVPLFYGP